MLAYYGSHNMCEVPKFCSTSYRNSKKNNKEHIHTDEYVYVY